LVIICNETAKRAAPLTGRMSPMPVVMAVLIVK
jgi:hypothetical protein